jgi:hypothetical protein
MEKKKKQVFSVRIERERNNDAKSNCCNFDFIPSNRHKFIELVGYEC